MMKKITLFLLFVAATATVFSQTGPEILHYKFDGTGSTVPNMASAAPVGTETATLLGGITQGPSGQCGGALIGSGNSSSSDYLNTNYATNLSGSWTISMWTKDITASATLFYIFGDGTAGSFRCFTNGVAGANNWILRGGFTDVYVNGGATVAPHITTFVYDATAGNIYAYLDGVLVSTVPQSPIAITGTGPFKVMGYNTNVGSPAGGKLDEFRMYSRALTTAEVADLVAFTSHTAASITACDNFTDNRGRVFNVAGTYADTVNSYLGCDSLVDLTITIHNSSAGSVNTTECDSYTAADGAVYTTSGTYSAIVPNAIGCDSTIAINLTVINSSVSNINPVNCNSYTGPDGTVYTSSGTYSEIIPNMAGCDSTITINLTINTPSSSTIAATGCGSYTAADGAIYTASGIETAIIPNLAGCDSTITINLTINTVDTSLTVSLPVITANATGSTYQWIDCGTSMPIAGETNQSFTATANGDYAVVVTTGSCSDTSACVNVLNTGIAQATADNTLSIYPNPTAGIFNIQTAAVADLLVVTDLLGRTVGQIKPVTTLTAIDMTGEKNGIYFVKIITEKATKTMKIVKQ